MTSMGTRMTWTMIPGMALVMAPAMNAAKVKLPPLMPRQMNIAAPQMIRPASIAITRNMYREQVPLLEHEQFNKAYRDHYIGKQTKLLSIVFATAIPWYVIGYVRLPISHTNIIIMAILAIISVSCFCISKKKARL